MARRTMMGDFLSGDMILSINGIDLVNKTHDEAVSIFRSQTGSEAQLLVEVGAEDRILNEHFTTDTRISAGKSFYEDSTELSPGSMTPAIRCEKDITRLTTAPLSREDTRAYLDDVPRTPKRPMSYFDPRK
ncbi:hypothetical protein OESDEN_25272 [Oesophagostomum dentatum]|uniref:PDZ domain-containing protein n=1 Tax=Oesophagostomum dentatum TaxID=61180 RepID=A0A0B1RVE1_OESDE|nr:hypothetical protein OESDEN_25272 [Oesophagostomum dentatum]